MNTPIPQGKIRLTIGASKDRTFTTEIPEADFDQAYEILTNAELFFMWRRSGHHEEFRPGQFRQNTGH